MDSDSHLTGYLYIIKTLYSRECKLLLQVHNEASLCKMYNTGMKHACLNNTYVRIHIYACVMHATCYGDKELSAASES